MILDPLKPKSIGNSHSVQDYYCAKLQVILIRVFRFIVLTYTPTYTHT